MGGFVMKTTIVVGLVVGVIVLTGCEDTARTAGLEQEVARMEGQSLALRQDIEARDKYIDEVMQSVNLVYKDLERAKSKEATITQRTQGVEGQPVFNSEQIRQSVLDQISAIGSNLSENRKRLASLQSRLKASGVKYASLEEMVQNLKQTLEQREQSVAMLEAQVKGLESTVAEKAQVIAEKENVIADQQNRLNTAYYVVGKRDELKQKGIISDEGGFLWGLVGTTTVLSSGVDESQFTPVDWTKDQTIRVEGKVVEIVPKRSGEFFAVAQMDETRDDLTITRPDKFWKEKFLVVVVD